MRYITCVLRETTDDETIEEMIYLLQSLKQAQAEGALGWKVKPKLTLDFENEHDCWQFDNMVDPRLHEGRVARMTADREARRVARPNG